MKFKEFLILVSIVLMDLITKIIANYYLPFHEYVSIFGDKVRFYLTYNFGATGSKGAILLSNESDKNSAIITICIIGLIMVCYILFIRKKEMRVLYKILIGITLYITLSLLFNLIKLSLAGLNISSWTASLAGKITGTMLYGSIFYISTNKLIRLSSLFVVAGGIGNLISHFYPPFRVIDFIEIEGTYELLRIGVFNLADTSIDIGNAGIVITLLVLFLKKIFSLIVSVAVRLKLKRH